MAYGPELVNIWAKTLQEQHLPVFIDRIEGGKEWSALRFSFSRNWLFLSWNSENNGCCLINQQDLAPFLESSVRHSTILHFLRKHILRSRLVKAEQINRDRIISFSFSRTLGAGFKTGIRLNLELTGNRSNMILMDENNFIREAAKHIHPDINRYRTIIPGVPYTPPPPFQGVDPANLSPEELKSSLSEIKGIGSHLSKVILRSWGKHPSERWLHLIRETIGDETSVRPLELMKCDNYLTVFPEVLEGCEPLGHDSLTGSAFMIAGAMNDSARSRLVKEGCHALDILIMKKQKHLAGLFQQVRNAEKAELFKKSGELLMGNSYLLNDGTDRVSLESWDGSGNVEILLDPSISIIQNAQKYFGKYRKYNLKKPETVKAKIASLQNSIQELQEEKELLQVMDDVPVLREATQDIIGWLGNKKEKKRNRSKHVPPHLKLEVDGYQILVGTNAKGNRYVTFHLARPGDIWFHVHEIPGSHVILKHVEEGEHDPGDTVILIAASLAAYYSKGRESLKMQVDYTEKKNVRPIPGSAIAHVTYTNPKTIMIRPDLWKEYI